MTRRLTALAAAGLALVASGCAGANPGVAAQVGNETISLNEVNRVSEQVCEALAPELSANQTILPMGNIRSGVAQVLALRAIGRQLAEEYGVGPGGGYRAAVAQYSQIATTLPKENRQAYVDVLSTSAYINDIRDAVGEKVLRAAGAASPTVEEISARGQEVLNLWPGQHPVKVDPRFGLDNSKGLLTVADLSTSFATSPQAMAANTENQAEYEAWIRSLPAEQRCGNVQ